MINNNFMIGTQKITNPNLYRLHEIEFEQGLPGYESVSHFKFVSLEDQGFAPFQLLSASTFDAHETPLAFIVIDEENSGLAPLMLQQRKKISTALMIDSFFEVYYMVTL